MNAVHIAAGRHWAALHFDPNDARREVWNGKWPGEEDCERLGFYNNGRVSSWVKKRTDDVSNHKFKIGQAVFYTSGVGSSRRSDVFRVMQRLPPEGGDY